MPVTQLPIDETEHQRVERWRAERLVQAGYSPEAAAELAARADIDLHRAEDLVESGCPPETARRILI